MVMVGLAPLKTATLNMVRAISESSLISVPGAYAFLPSELETDSSVVGVFLTRATKYGTTYFGSVDAHDLYENNGGTSFNPTYTAMVKHNDIWKYVPVNAQGQCEGSFRIDSTFDIEASDKLSIGWELDADAPAAVYGIKCAYPDPVTREIHESIFYIVYTDAWTYLSIYDQNGSHYLNNFGGGSDRTLTVQVSFNDGAITPTWEPINDEIDDSGVKYGAISKDEIISLDTLQFTIKSITGESYNGMISVQRIPNTNLVSLIFADNLANGTYVLQVSSTVDDKIYGELVIYNGVRNAGINLSRIWIFFMVAGGLIVLTAVIMFFLPLSMSKINARRVDKENARIARMKNPEAYANKSGTLFQRLQTKLKKMANRKQKDGAATEEAKPQAEPTPAFKPKFTDLLRERREQRDGMNKGEKNTATTPANKATQEATEKTGFAFLRDDDDDDEIASLREVKEEVSTIETGSYVEDGVTFAKLDSLQGENDDQNGQ